MIKIADILKNNEYVDKIEIKHLVNNPKITYYSALKTNSSIAFKKWANVYFIMLSQELLKIYDNLQKEGLQNLQEDMLGKEFYSDRTDLRWNYYIYMIFDDDSLLERIDIDEVQEDDNFAKKVFIRIENLNDYLKPITPEISKSNNENKNSVLSDWEEDLRKVGLDKCIYKRPTKKELIEYIDDYKKITSKNNHRNNKRKKDVEIITKLKGLKTKGYRVDAFGEEFKIEFSDITLIEGSNGAGKTSCLEAIEYAITNDIKRKRHLKKQTKEGKTLVECYNANNDIIPLESNKSISKCKDIDSLWYSTPSHGGSSTINDSFSMFNLFSTDEIFFFSRKQAGLDKDENDYNVLSRLYFGEEISQIKEELSWCKEQLISIYGPKKREYDRKFEKYKDTESRIAALEINNFSTTKNYEDEIKRILQLIKDEKYVDIESSILLLEKTYIRYKDGISFLENNTIPEQVVSYKDLVDKEDEYALKKNDIEELIEEYEAIQIEKSKSVDHCSILEYEINEKNKELKELKRRQKREKNLILKMKNYKIKYGELVERYNYLKELDSIVNHIKLKYSIIFDSNIEVYDPTEKLQNTRITLNTIKKEIEKTTSKINKNDNAMLGDMINSGKKLINQNNSNNCPLCGHNHENKEYLLNEIEKQFEALLKDNEIELLEKLRNYEFEFEINQKKYDELLNMKEINLMYLDLVEFASEKFEINSEKMSKEELLGILRKKEVEALDLINYESLIIEYNDLFNINDLKKEFDLEGHMLINDNKIDAIKIDILRIESKYNKVDKDIKKYNLLMTSSRFARIFEKSESINAKIIEIEKWIDVINDFKIRLFIDSSTNLKELKLIVTCIEPLYRSLVSNKELEDLRTINDNSKKEIEAEEERLDRCKNAIKVFKNLRSTEDEVMSFIENNFSMIKKIFDRIHLPKEFEVKGLSQEDGKLLIKRKNDYADIHEMSSGQRTSLAIAFMLAKNISAKNAPKFILFDDPIANFDDLHFMNLVDVLRELAFMGIQLIITTANEDIASYYRRKFSFFENRFTHYKFNRHNNEITKYYELHYKPNDATPMILENMEVV